MNESTSRTFTIEELTEAAAIADAAGDWGKPETQKAIALLAAYGIYMTPQPIASVEDEGEVCLLVMFPCPEVHSCHKSHWNLGYRTETGDGMEWSLRDDTPIEPSHWLRQPPRFKEDDEDILADVLCPHCGHDCTAAFVADGIDDPILEDREKVECSECKKRFNVTVHRVYSTTPAEPD